VPSLRDQTAKDNQKGAPLYLLAIAFLLFVFGVVAEAVVEGKSSAFDRSIILAFRDHGIRNTKKPPHHEKIVLEDGDEETSAGGAAWSPPSTVRSRRVSLPDITLAPVCTTRRWNLYSLGCMQP